MMRIARAADKVGRDPASTVTIGTFDGIHSGHREIIRRTVQAARAQGGRSVVVTFEPHPKEVVASLRGPVRLLTTMDERLELLEQLQIDCVYIVAFTREFSRLPARSFYEQHLVGTVGVRHVVIGEDHMFGADRKAGRKDLEELGRDLGFTVETVPPHMVHGERVSSTQIRHALEAGNVERATAFLGYAYQIAGTVVEGDGRGRALGYPTANIRPASPGKLIPARGVYVVRVVSGGGVRYGMMNIGIRPTVTDGSEQTLEVHVFDFDGRMYGEQVRIGFLHRLREEQQFASAEELQQQLARDRERSLAMVQEYGNTGQGSVH